MRAYIREEKVPDWQILGETETVPNSLDPDFMHPFNLNYYFERNQLLKFEVLDNEGKDKTECVGEFTTTLGELMGSKEQKMSKHLVLPGASTEKKHQHKRGKIIIRAENVDGGNNEIHMQVEARLTPMRSCFCRGNDKPYLVIERARNIPESLMENGEIRNLIWEDLALSAEEMSDADMVPVFKSEHKINDINP